MIKAGIYTDLSNEDYHADKNSLSRTSIKDFHRNPKYYWSMHLNDARPSREPTRDMILGSAFHSLVLEPNKFEYEYSLALEKVLLKDVGRELYDEYKLQCEELERTNRIILTNDEYMNLLAMKISLNKSMKVIELLYGEEIEKSFFWEDKDSGLIVKARPDVLHDNMIVDLKTIRDASVHAYQRDMVDGWYHVQGAMVRDAVRTLENREINTVINICVEKKYPYCIGVYIIDEFALDHAEQLYKSVLLNMKSCIIDNEFEDFKPQIVGLPKWSL